MRIVSVLFTLLVITVTSLALPQVSENSNKTTTAVPLTPEIKNEDTPSGTPASMGKSNDKPNNVIAHTTPSVTTPGKLKEDNVKFSTLETKTAATPVTSDSKIDLSSTIKNSSDKINSSTIITTTTITSINTTTAAPPTTQTTATSIIATSPTTTEIVTNNNSIVSTTAVPPNTTTCPPSDRHFDGLSFLGGIILTICLIGIGIFLCKYCQHVCEDKYRTL
ncbi:hypothetical protein M0802_010816 [Mischocyttarus mexicanus]|nr:hypothetical protein M0802_010816 [Mischocyttarus mexicanus]